MAEFTPINFFPNFIFIPKIVPLVYDDTLSYYEFLNKVLVKLNEMIQNVNDLGLDVEELKSAVEQLSTLIDGFDDRISDLETNMTEVQNAVDAVNTALEGALEDIEDLKAADTSIEGRLDDIETQITTDIAAAVAALQQQIGSVSSDVNAMQSQVTSNTGRIEALEDATLNAPTEANENLIVGQFQNLENLDYEIVVVTDNGASTNNIEVYDGLIRFRPEASHNECALVIKNVLPVLVGTYTSSMILSFGDKYKTSGSNNGTDYCINVPFTSLTGSTPYIANSGYTTTRASLRVLQLKVGSDGKSYDLWIYNKYNGDYPILPGANISILALAMVFRGFDNSFTTAAIKAYFSTVYGNTAPQVSALIDKKSSGIVSRAVNQANIYTDVTADNLAAEIERSSQSCDEYSDFNDATMVDESTVHQGGLGYTEVTFNEIQNLNSDVTVDFTKCKYGVSQYPGSNDVLNPIWEEIRLYINIEVTITGSGAVNTANSIPVVNIANTLGATIPSIIPLPVHAALPSKAPFCEAYLHTNGNVIFRCWFDDTNWDFSQNPVTVRIAGFVPLPYQHEFE